MPKDGYATALGSPRKGPLLIGARGDATPVALAYHEGLLAAPRAPLVIRALDDRVASRAVVRPSDTASDTAWAREVLEQHHNLEQVRALLGHRRNDTTQVHATIRPAQLKRAVAFYEDKAARMLSD